MEERCCGTPVGRSLAGTVGGPGPWGNKEGSSLIARDRHVVESNPRAPANFQTSFLPRFHAFSLVSNRATYPRSPDHLSSFGPTVSRSRMVRPSNVLSTPVLGHFPNLASGSRQKTIGLVQPASGGTPSNTCSRPSQRLLHYFRPPREWTETDICRNITRSPRIPSRS